MHADDFRQDLYGLVTMLKNGGYSDDMTLAAIAGNVLGKEQCLLFNVAMETLLRMYTILTLYYLRNVSA